MDTEDKQASRGLELAVVSALEFLGLDSKSRIPVGQNFRVLAWIDRDRTHVEYFRRRRFGKRRQRDEKKCDHKLDFSNNCCWNHHHKSRVSSSSLLAFEPECTGPIQSATNPSPFLCLRKSQVQAHALAGSRY